MGLGKEGIMVPDGLGGGMFCFIQEGIGSLHATPESHSGVSNYYYDFYCHFFAVHGPLPLLGYARRVV